MTQIFKEQRREKKSTDFMPPKNRLTAFTLPIFLIFDLFIKPINYFKFIWAIILKYYERRFYMVTSMVKKVYFIFIYLLIILFFFLIYKPVISYLITKNLIYHGLKLIEFIIINRIVKANFQKLFQQLCLFETRHQLTPSLRVFACIENFYDIL